LISSISRSAQQRPALLLLEVVEREVGGFVEVDLAVEQERLAGRALTLLAAVHEHEALPERAAQDRLVLVDFEFDAHRLQADVVGLSHSHSLDERRAGGERRLTAAPASRRRSIRPPSSALLCSLVLSWGHEL
jgi:hypothetical protein